MFLCLRAVIGGLMPDAMSGIGVSGFMTDRMVWVLAGE